MNLVQLILEFNQKLEQYILEFSADYGTSGFFSSPGAAASWVQSRIIDPNPELTSTQKMILTEYSKNAVIDANNQTGLNSKQKAAYYWQQMAVGIGLNTNNETLFQLFDVAVDAAQDTANPPSNQPEGGLFNFRLLFGLLGLGLLVQLVRR